MSEEKENETTLTITEIGPLKYGNPDATISYEKKLASGELTQPVADRVAELLGSGELLVAVDNQDDGCIDGRPTESVLFIDENGEFTTHESDNHGHERAKVAGGGYFTATAMRLGAGYKGESIDDDILTAGSELTIKGVFCGAHTGEHQHGEATDCGANDKLLSILYAALQFEDEIADTTRALIEQAGMEYNPETFKAVIAKWQTVVGDEDYFAESAGGSRLSAVEAIMASAHNATSHEKPLSVIKKLSGDHKEIGLVVNYVQDKTFSQVALADELKKSFPEIEAKGLPQTFVVDAWRLVELAKASVQPEEFETALYAGVMYQAATAATLTDGSLPTFIYS